MQLSNSTVCLKVHVTSDWPPIRKANISNLYAFLSRVVFIVRESTEEHLLTLGFRSSRLGGLGMNVENSCRWSTWFDIGVITANFLCEDCPFNFVIQTSHELCYVSFRRLLSLLLCDPPRTVFLGSPGDFMVQVFCRMYVCMFSPSPWRPSSWWSHST